MIYKKTWVPSLGCHGFLAWHPLWIKSLTNNRNKGAKAAFFLGTRKLCILCCGTARMVASLSRHGSRRVAKFVETTLLKLPAGTLDKIREAADREGTKPTDFMRRAVIRALKESQTEERTAS
jgi:hypothetical protein